MTCPRSADGEPVFWRSHRRAWEQVRTAAGITELRVHDLRHTAATFWLSAGLSVHAVGQLLGHADAGLTLRLYGHALPQETATAADRLESWRAAQRP
jgi:integrase